MHIAFLDRKMVGLTYARGQGVAACNRRAVERFLRYGEGIGTSDLNDKQMRPLYFEDVS